MSENKVTLESISIQIIAGILVSLFSATMYQIWTNNDNFKTLQNSFTHTVEEITLMTNHLADRIEMQEGYLTKLNDIKIDHLYASVEDIKNN